MNEISGLAWDKDNFVYAVDDDQGSLFRINLQKDVTVEEWKFGKKNDYEELVLTGNTFYLLSSSGSIVYFPNQLPIAETRTAELSLKGKNEFEILLKDPGEARLLMICKGCKGNKKNKVSVYAFDLASKRFEEEPVATLNVKDIEERVNEKLGAFKPSGAGVHPQTGEIYVVSSINKLLVVTDRNFSVKEVHKLPAGTFKQPEGICFTPSGDMLISNEAAGEGTANILWFKAENQ